MTREATEMPIKIEERDSVSVTVRRVLVVDTDAGRVAERYRYEQLPGEPEKLVQFDNLERLNQLTDEERKWLQHLSFVLERNPEDKLLEGYTRSVH